MSQFSYATKTIETNMVRALLIDAPVSTKTSIEIANHIRGKSVERAKKILEESISLTKPIPYKRFTNGPGHKKGKGIGSGRFAVKTCQQFLGLLVSAESNARDKGLNANDLVIHRLIVQQASAPWHYGRQTRRKMKRSHVELIAKEQVPAKKDDKKADTKKVDEKKVEVAKEAPKTAPKPQPKEQKPAPKESKPKSESKETKQETKPAAKPAAKPPVTSEKTKETPEKPKEENGKPKVNEKMLKG